MSWSDLQDKIAVAPSLLSADFSNLGPELGKLEACSVDMLHIDVMDGHFVPNITLGPFIVKAIDKYTDIFLDAHLMVSYPHKFIDAFAQAGADAITFHIESDSDTIETIKQIRNQGVRPGLSLKPGTPVDAIIDFLPLVDLVLVMSVEPGFGGQEFDESAVAKIMRLNELQNEPQNDFLISVDGGINDKTGYNCVKAGADILVSGSWLLNSENIEQRIEILSNLNGIT